MHFIGMLAFAVPGMSAEYDLSLTLVSLAAPIIVTAIGFVLVTGAPVGPLGLGAAGVIMGLGIVDLCFEGSRVPRRRGSTAARRTRSAQSS